MKIMSSNINEYFVELTKKWSRMLFENRVYEADSEPSKPKFFITAAFMYPNGPIHIGHGRTYLVADILARFKRLMGYNVLFPMGFHYTGTPIIAMAESVAEGDKELIELFTTLYRVPREEMARMTDPLYMARYFHNVSKEVMKLYGLSIDWRREFTTIDPEFKQFIHWQFSKLHEKGYIERGSHPVGWCPKHGMPVGMHDTKGDVEPEIGEFIAIMFRDSEGIAYPTATLRPETIFGVTNLWVNPNAKYAKVRLDNGDIWIVGAKAAERLRHQLEFEIVDYIDGEALIGRYVVNPITGERVPVLPARFVDDSFATGVVMSVPAHAPYDAIALEDIKRNPKYYDLAKDISVRVIIEVNGRKIANAYEALKEFGIASQDDRSKLDEATRYVYSLELRSGFMARDLHSFVPSADMHLRMYIEDNISGKSVEIAREAVKKVLLDRGFGVEVYELLNKPVFCRCGTEVVVKLLKDQWFIDYGNSKWKEMARRALARMVIVPEEARQQFEATINWLKRRACARTRGLGVPLPWDSRWIIESLSDSTIYMAFYTVIHKIRSYSIPPEKLNEEFWDYVLLGRGDVEALSERLGIPTRILEDIHKEFAYWYPLDFRVSGKDLIPNHLTFFIFNHVAIFPEEYQPKGIIANGWVLVKQQKMSKSLRNIIPLLNIIEEYGSDIVRLLIALNAEVPQDENIDPESLEKLCRYEYPQILMWIYNTAVKIYEGRDKLRNEMNSIDRIFWNEFLYRLSKAITLLENAKIREAGVVLFYDITNLLNKYLGLVETPHKMVLDILKMWIPMISAYAPFIAEEIWSKTFNQGFASLQKIEIPSGIDELELFASRYINSVILESVDNIMRATKKSSINRLTIYVAQYEHQKIMRLILELHKKGLKLSDIINNVSSTLGIDKRDASHLVRSMYDIAISILDELANLYIKFKDLDEYKVLSDHIDYLTKLINARIEIYRAEDPSAPDRGGKKRVALPLKPGIYIE